MKRAAFAIGLTYLAIGHTASAALLTAATGVVTSWDGNPGAGPGFLLYAKITTGVDAARNATAGVGIKRTGGASRSVTTSRVNGIANVNLWGQGQVNYSGDRGLLGGATFSYAMAPKSAGPAVVITQTVDDPFGYVVGPVGTDLVLSEDINQGTQVQRRNVDPNLPVPTLSMNGRAGLGTANFSQDNPAGFWPGGVDVSSPPTGADDLFKINIFENALNQLDATVQLPPTTSNLMGFSQTFNGSSDLLAQEQAIRAAIIAPQNWSVDSNYWTLNTDIHVLDYDIQNDSEANVGQTMTIGSQEMQQDSIPEPTVASMCAMAICGSLCRRKRRA